MRLKYLFAILFAFIATTVSAFDQTSPGVRSPVTPSGNIGVDIGATAAATDAGFMFDMSQSTSNGVVIFTSGGQTVGSANALLTLISTGTSYTGYFLRIFNQNGNNSNGYIRMDGPNPQMEFVETDQVAPAGKFEWANGVGDRSCITGRNSADSAFENNVCFQRLDGAFGGGLEVMSDGDNLGSVRFDNLASSYIGFKASGTFTTGGSWDHTLWDTANNANGLLYQATNAPTRNLAWTAQPANGVNDMTYIPGTGFAASTSTFTHQLDIPTYTKAQIDTLVPKSVNSIIKCSNCTRPYTLCSSTGTLAGQWDAMKTGNGCGTGN